MHYDVIGFPLALVFLDCTEYFLNSSLFIANYFKNSTGQLLSFLINFVSKEVGEKSAFHFVQSIFA